MPKFWVELPITGQIGREIEADSAKEAIDIALEKDLTDEEKENMQWETCREVIPGNVSRAMLTRAHAQEIE